MSTSCQLLGFKSHLLRLLAMGPWMAGLLIEKRKLWRLEAYHLVDSLHMSTAAEDFACIGSSHTDPIFHRFSSSVWRQLLFWVTLTSNRGPPPQRGGQRDARRAQMLVVVTQRTRSCGRHGSRRSKRGSGTLLRTSRSAGGGGVGVFPAQGYWTTWQDGARAMLWWLDTRHGSEHNISRRVAAAGVRATGQTQQ